MAAISINYEVSATACAAGNHYDLTATISGLGQDITTTIHPPHLAEQPSNREAKEALDVITWILFKKYLISSSHSEVHALLNNKQIVLDPQPIT